MLTIPIAFFIVMLELTIGSMLVLYALDVRNDSSLNFFRTQAAFVLLIGTTLTWGTMQGFARSSQLQSFGYNLDFHWLRFQESTLTWFIIFQVLYFLNLLINARMTRLIVGGVMSALGLAELLVVGMGYRTVAAAHLGGAPTVAAFILGALSLGGVTTAMFLGHWYLNTPTASGKPLEFATALTIGGIVAQVFFGLIAGPATYTPVHHTQAIAPATSAQSHATTQAQTPALRSAPQSGAKATPTPVPTPSVASPVPHGVEFNTLTLILLEYFVGLGIPFVLSGIAFILERERSFQSATGMLYIAVVFAFFGEILARNLFLQPLT